MYCISAFSSPISSLFTLTRGRLHHSLRARALILILYTPTSHQLHSIERAIYPRLVILQYPLDKFIMTAQMEPSVMDVDSDHSPSVKSDNSSILFKDDYATLPSTGHLSHAHIVDLDECVDLAKDDGMVKLQDAVVTTLFHVSPDTLRSFLSPTVNAFKAVFGKKDTQLVIWRRGLEVFVSGRAFRIRPRLTYVRRSARSRTIPASRCMALNTLQVS
jgi:hypothetical protein